MRAVSILSGLALVLAVLFLSLIRRAARRARARAFPGILPDTAELNRLLQDLRAGCLTNKDRLFRGLVYQGLIRNGLSPADALERASDPRINTAKINFKVAYT